MKRIQIWQQAGLAILALAFGTSCSSTKPGANGTASAINPPLASHTQAANKKEDESDRKIESSDLVIIEVYDQKELTVERRVEKSGSISYPFLGNLLVANLTTAEVTELLRKRLAADYLINPQVTVTVKDFRARVVSVIGAVTTQAAIELQKDERLEIVEAISRAHGFTPIANKKRIEHTRNGITKAYTYDELVRTKIWVEPGDIINVPESFW